MKFVVTSLKLGETVAGSVSELLSGGEILINIAGDLLRVHNETHETFIVGQNVSLVVEAIQPLRFRLQASRVSLRSKGRLDVSI
jgi:hypothetical protein